MWVIHSSIHPFLHLHLLLANQHLLSPVRSFVCTFVQLNTAFKHMLYFIFEFDLVKTKELIPLKPVILTLLGDKYADRFEKRSRR